MAKSVQNYIDELYSQGKTEADRLKEQRTQADDKLIQQTNAAIDKAAAASAKPYQTQLDELPRVVRQAVRRPTRCRSLSTAGRYRKRWPTWG